MKMHSTYTDDQGQKWELKYEEHWNYKTDPETGELVKPLVDLPSTFFDFRYRKWTEDDSAQWQELPPWVLVSEDALTTMCLFFEDEETGELTFCQPTSGPLNEDQ